MRAVVNLPRRDARRAWNWALPQSQRMRVLLAGCHTEAGCARLPAAPLHGAEPVRGSRVGSLLHSRCRTQPREQMQRAGGQEKRALTQQQPVGPA